MSESAPQGETLTGYQAIRAASLSQRLKYLARDSALYGGVTAISSLFNLFTVPILTRIFATGEYGAVDAITVFGAIFVVLIRMGQDSAVARFFYETEDPEERKQIVTESLLIQMVPCVVLTALLFAFAPYIVSGLLGTREYALAFRVLVLSLPFSTLLFFSRNMLKWVFARRQFILIGLGSTVGVILLTLLFVAVFRFGVTGVFCAQLLGLGTFSIAGLYLCRSYLMWPRTFIHGRHMLRFGWPYMVIAVTAAVIPAVDRFFITHYLNLESMGLYAVGYKFAFLLMLPITAFQTAWAPFGFAIYKEANAAETYNKVLTYYVASITVLAFCLIAVSQPMISLLASSRYLAGSIVVMPIAFGLILESTAWILGLGLDLSKRTHFSALSYFMGLSVSALTIWFLIRPLGILGVAYGMMAGRVAQGFGYSFFAYRAHPLRFGWKIPGVVLGAGLALSVVTQKISPALSVYTVGARVLLLLVLLGIIWKGAIRAREREAILREGKAAISAAISRSRVAWSRS